MARERHRKRLDRVHARVPGVDVASVGVDPHPPVELAGERTRELARVELDGQVETLSVQVSHEARMVPSFKRDPTRCLFIEVGTFCSCPVQTNIPDRVVRAMSRPIIDHRGREFGELAVGVHDGLQALLQTDDPLAIYPSSGRRLGGFTRQLPLAR